MGKKKFKWNQFEGIGDGLDWYAHYGNEELGFIEYWKPWKKFVWNQHQDIIMSLSCMEEVIKKLKELESS